MAANPRRTFSAAFVDFFTTVVEDLRHRAYPYQLFDANGERGGAEAARRAVR